MAKFVKLTFEGPDNKPREIWINFDNVDSFFSDDTGKTAVAFSSLEIETIIETPEEIWFRLTR